MRIPNFLLKQQAIIYKSAGTGAYGPVLDDNPQFSRCYLEPSRQNGKNSNDETITSTALAIFPPKTPITVDSKVIVDGNEYFVISVVPSSSWTDSYMEVLLK